MGRCRNLRPGSRDLPAARRSSPCGGRRRYRAGRNANAGGRRHRVMLARVTRRRCARQQVCGVSRGLQEPSPRRDGAIKKPRSFEQGLDAKAQGPPRCRPKPLVVVLVTALLIYSGGTCAAQRFARPSPPARIAPWQYRCRFWRFSGLLQQRLWLRWPWLRRGLCREWRCR